MENNIISRFQSLKEWLRGYEDSFTVIGGTACSLIMNESGADFRATKDVDIVIILEALNEDFGQRFWEYIKEAEYRHRQRSTGKPQYYRFYEPKSKNYPEMIELFSRRIDGLMLPDDVAITPIPISEDISSLSAILLDDQYYNFLRDGVRKIDNFPVLDELYIIPFKAKAWLNLTEQRNKGLRVHRNDINKHSQDIYKLVDIVTGGYKFSLPESIENDMKLYITSIRKLLDNTPRKEREANKLRLDKIMTFFAFDS